MKSLTQLWFLSLLTLSQNLVLLWPFFAFFTVMSIITAMTDTTPMDLTTPNIVMLLLCLLLFVAFLCGTMGMTVQAMRVSLGLPTPSTETSGQPVGTTPKPNPFQSFLLLKEFFPAIGSYFGRFITGFVIQVLLVIVLALLFNAALEYWIGYPHFLDSLWPKLGQMTPEQLESHLQALPFAQKMHLGKIAWLMIGGFLIYGLFNLMTMLWPALIITHDISATQAYFKSIRQFFRDPFRMVSTLLCYVGSVLGFTLLMSGGNTLMMSLYELILLLADLWFKLAVCGYALSLMHETNPSNGQPEKPSGISLNA